jgi:hypothetical protein
MAEPGWRKRGLLFRPDGQGGWLNSHAQVPTALLLEDRIRVFIASRPRSGLSLTGWVDLDRARPERVVRIGEAPILQPGERGSFDEHGIMPAAVVTAGDEVRLYYSGWCRLAGGAPYHNSTGLAVSDDNGENFRRACPGPVLDRGPWEPFSAFSPCVLLDEGVWHAFYSSGISWVEVDGKLEHVYDLHHATSADGIEWQRDRKSAVPQSFPEEALTRPTVIRQADGNWAMWFSHRGSKGFRAGGDSYRIGFAHSTDLWSWDRLDAYSGIATSAEGWDSKMIAYPCVLEADGRRLLFYNGNGFGRDGFGWAEWEE